MKLQRMGAVILVAATAAMLAAATATDTMPHLAIAGAPAQQGVQGREPAAVASAAAYTQNPALTPADATWGSVFSAHWR